ncbi:hypothetical protein J6590_046663 [Homalodisca vitripennis]|nr:hypothetical protein J6590_046663 [Homalodisca vitripennis]
MEVAHVTDTHVDLKYTAGAAAKGNYQPQSTSSSGDTAGLWGSYKSCDIPTSTVYNLLDTLSTRHKV